MLLRGPSDGLAHGLTQSDSPPMSQHWGNSSKGTKDIQGGTELSGIDGTAGGAAFSQTKVLAEAIVPFLSPPPTETEGRNHYLSLHQPGYHC